MEVIRELMSAGASLHAEDERGMMALHMACRAGALEACHELLRLGARADAIDHDGLEQLAQEIAASDRFYWPFSTIT